MKTHQILPFALAFVGGFGGLVNGLTFWDMIDSLNSVRPPDGQIPVAGVTPGGRRFWFCNFRAYKLTLIDFRREFPNDRRLFWHAAGLIWMVTFFVAAAIAGFAFR